MDRMDRVECTKDSQQISFLLSSADEGLFYRPAFRIMQHPDVTCLVPCNLGQINGRLRFSYQTACYQPVREIMLREPAYIFQIALGLIDTMNKIDDIGFLCASNLRWTPAEVMMDRNSKSVSMIYLPLQPDGVSVNPTILKSYLDRLLIQCVQVNQQLSGSAMGRTIIDTVQKAEDLDELEKSIRQLADRVKKEREAAAAREAAAKQQAAYEAPARESAPEGEKKSRHGLWPFGKKKGRAAQLVLAGQGEAGSLRFILGEQEEILGKSREKASLIVDFPKVSRSHCKIKVINGVCYVMDLNSTNGTYVNQRRLPAGEWMAAEAGAEVRLANISFLIVEQG